VFKKSYRGTEALHLLNLNQCLEGPPRVGRVERISMHAALSDDAIAGKFHKILALENTTTRDFVTKGGDSQGDIVL